MDSDGSEDGNRCFDNLTQFLRIYMAYLRRYYRLGCAFLCFERVRI